MKLKSAEQLPVQKLADMNSEILIAASGYESRCIALSQKIYQGVRWKYVIRFKEHKNLSQRAINDAKFADMRFIAFEAQEGSFHDILGILDKVVHEADNLKSFTVVIDYSCMTKVWYSTILNYFINRRLNAVKISLVFSYTPSRFTPPQTPMPNGVMGPLPGIFRISASQRPTALILGLGYEKESAKGLMDYLDPKITFAFYSKPALDEQFAEHLERNNCQLLEQLGTMRTFTHPLMDLKATESQLLSLCEGLRQSHRVILAPLGPKPFALLCLLIATKLQDVDVWRVSCGSHGNLYDRAPLEVDPIVCNIELSQ
jgi:hypothetical protein